jgi:hypothetical protein
MYTTADALFGILSPPLRVDVLKRRLYSTNVPADILAKVVLDDQLYFNALNAGVNSSHPVIFNKPYPRPSDRQDQTATDKGLVKNHWMARVLIAFGFNVALPPAAPGIASDTANTSQAVVAASNPTMTLVRLAARTRHTATLTASTNVCCQEVGRRRR